MLRYRLFLLTLALICALVATVLWHVVMGGSTSEQQPMVMVPIAAQNIAAMTVVSKEQIEMVEMPVAEVSKLNVITQEADIVGKRIFEAVEAKSPFLKSNIQDQESEGPFYLPEGYRAITIENSPLIGVAGYLEPGMYVDVLWTYESENGNKQKVKRTAVGLQNVKVLAVNTASAAGADGAKESNTITLMLKLNDAKWLTLMTETGKVKLLLRPSSVDKTEPVAPPTIPDNPLPPAEVIIINN